MKIILVTGPSGAGKDTLLRLAREHFRTDKQVCFARRYITRIPDENEENYFIDRDAFTLLRENNFFISHWQAHGNYYGISRTELTNLPRKSVSIISISRGSIADFESSFQEVITLCLTVRKDILRSRLQARGREDERAIEKRLQRTTSPLSGGKVICFDNSESLSVSGRQFLNLLDSLAKE